MQFIINNELSLDFFLMESTTHLASWQPYIFYSKIMWTRKSVK